VVNIGASFKVLCRHFRGGTEENYEKNFIRNNRALGRVLTNIKSGCYVSREPQSDSILLSGIQFKSRRNADDN
jgi:hypothetical protein